MTQHQARPPRKDSPLPHQRRAARETRTPEQPGVCEQCGLDLTARRCPVCRL